MNSKTNGFYGAIIGDIVGSAFERSGIAPKDYPLFSKESHITDDTVLTLATMDLLLKGAIQTNDSLRIATTYRTWGKRFPQAGYGGGFLWWLDHPIKGPYVSKGNGAAMEKDEDARKENWINDATFFTKKNIYSHQTKPLPHDEILEKIKKAAKYPECVL